MKLIVDIPEVDYNYAKQQVADGITNPLKIFIASGTPIPDNATNGEVIKLIFDEEDIWDIHTALNLYDETRKWWNTLYSNEY